MSDEATLDQLVRGIILAVLRLSYPRELAAVVVRSEVADTLGEEAGSDWRSHLAYLEDRGYIARSHRDLGVGRRDTLRLAKLRLTPDGLLVVEGTRQDPGVALPRG